MKLSIKKKKIDPIYIVSERNATFYNKRLHFLWCLFLPFFIYEIIQPFCKIKLAYWLLSPVATIAYAFPASS